MSQNNREVLFAKKLEDVKRQAREQGGTISEEQVKEAFLELEIQDEQLQLVYDYLKSSNIGVGEEADPDAFMSQEERDYLQMYLDDLELLPSYTDGQKTAYTIAAMAGEVDAQKTLIEIYLKDVVELAKIYTGQGVLIEDLIGEGNVALSIGVTMLGSQEKPEECEGVLIKLVMDAMEELIKESMDSDATGKKIADKVNKVNEKADNLSKELGRKVSVKELAEEEEGLSENAIQDALVLSGFQIDGLEDN